MKNLTAAQIRPVQKATQNCKICQGNQKVTSVGKGISAVATALDSCGFALDMVSGDILLGEKGSRRLPFSVQLPMGETESTNKFISFTWENLSGDQFNPSFEIIAYVC